MRAAVYHGPRDIRVETVPDPVCGERDLVLRVTACGVCGSDLHSYTKGLFVEPGQIMGHEFAGEVVEVGRLVEGVRVGDRITASPAVDCGRCARCIAGEPLLCQNQAGNIISGGFPGGFAEYLRVPSARPGQSVFVLPEGVTDEVGATTEPMGVGLRAAHHAAPSAYDTCVVFGLGMIGQVAVQALKVAGAERVIGVDVARQRLDAAAALGADVVVDASQGDTLARLIELTGGGSVGYGGGGSGQADVVVECTGVPAVLDQALDAVRRGGALVQVALYEEAPAIDLNRLVIKELRVHGSFGYGGVGYTGFRDALRLLADGRARTEPLITHRLPLDAIDEAFRIQLDRDASIKVMVLP